MTNIDLKGHHNEGNENYSFEIQDSQCYSDSYSPKLKIISYV